MEIRHLVKLLAWTPLFLTCVAMGQEGEPDLGVIGLVQVMNDKQTQKELKFNEGQIEEATSIAKLLAQVRDGKAQLKAKKRVAMVLTVEQYVRLKYLHVQHLDGYALLVSWVADKLGLTEEQRKKLREAKATNTAEHRKMLDFVSRTRFRSREALEQYKAKYRAAANKRLRAALTKKQAAAFEKILIGFQGFPTGNVDCPK